MSAEGMGTIRLVPGGAKIGIGGVGLRGNKRPYIWIEDGSYVWTLGTLNPHITPSKFWELMERVIGKPIIDEEQS